MNPTWMLTMLLGLGAAFAWSANRRWQLLKVGRPENRSDHLITRLKVTWEYALRQRKMGYYPLAGLAHKLIFVGFIILLLRSVMLWGRGFDPTFSLWIFGPEPVSLFGAKLPLGHLYDFLKDVTASLVVFGALVFVYFRVIKRESRMTLSGEGVLILAIILVMMLSDMMYDGASMVLHHRHAYEKCNAAADPVLCGRIQTLVAHFGGPPADQALSWSLYPSPAGSLFAMGLDGAGPESLILFAHMGFWAHATLVMVFLNLLPHSKHFHIITSLPNVFATSLEPAGKLPTMAPA